MVLKRSRWMPSDTYFALVKQFPLTHLRDEDHLIAAQEMLDHLLQADLDEGAQEYLDVLTDLVEDYEEKQIAFPDPTEAEVLAELMRGKGLSSAQLAKAAGISPSTLSAVLKGSRTLTKNQIVKLAAFFHVSPSAFLPV